jgi:hypothetical protein
MEVGMGSQCCLDDEATMDSSSSLEFLAEIPKM